MLSCSVCSLLFFIMVHFSLLHRPFRIPVLPSGHQLTINILSTWGDPYYVGLSGIEMFDQNGQPISVSNVKKQIRADPSDINILPGYANDPRTVDKLLDGVNKTCDDLHAWLAPFTRGQNHYIMITFDRLETLGMMRFWVR